MHLPNRVTRGVPPIHPTCLTNRLRSGSVTTTDSRNGETFMFSMHADLGEAGGGRAERGATGATTMNTVIT